MKIAIAICILTTYLVVAKLEASPSSSPSLTPSMSPSPSALLDPSVICSTIIYDMADCFGFLINGSSEEKPIPSCCSGFKAILRSNAECICEALKSSAELGIDVNLTKAATLPSACQVFAPPMIKCDVSSSLAIAPANPPSSGTPSPAPSTAAGEVAKHAPTPAALSGTYSLSACFFLLISMLVISFSYINFSVISFLF